MQINLSSVQNKALEYLDGNYTCCQSIIKAYTDAGILPTDINEDMFSGFGGGFAGTGRTCGTIVAATVIISAIGVNKDNKKDRSKIYDALRRIYKRVEEEYSSLNCIDITKIDFTNSEEAKLYSVSTHEQVCKPLIKYVVEQISIEIGNFQSED